MLRLIFFFVVIAFAALGVTWMLEQQGSVSVDYAGYRIDTTPGILALAVLLFGFLMWLLISLFLKIIAVPALLGRAGQARRNRHGLKLMEQAMLELDEGEPQKALAHALKADKLLDRPTLSQPLVAKAAMAHGHHEKAIEVLEAMTNNPQTRRAGLRGLLDEALEQGDDETALKLARDVAGMGDKSAQLLSILFDLEVAHQHWNEALNIIGQQVNSKHMQSDQANERRALILTEKARSLPGEDHIGRLQHLKEAHKMDSAHPGVVNEYARELARNKQQNKAFKVIKEAWAKSPHPDLLAAAHPELAGLTEKDRNKKLDQIFAANPDHRETKIAMATRALEDGNIQRARELVTNLLEDEISQRVCMLMAAVEKESIAGETVVRAWLAKALSLPRDNVWVCSDCGQEHEHWQAVCDHCGEFATIMTGGRSGQVAEKILSAPIMGLLGNGPTDGPPSTIHPEGIDEPVVSEDSDPKRPDA